MKRLRDRIAEVRLSVPHAWHRSIMTALESNFSTTSSGVPAGFIVIMAIVALLFVFWLWTLIDAIRRPESNWRADDRRQVSWILVIVFLGWLGSLLYVVIARPSLNRTRQSA
jgi:sterol desaturase/sphingolipid hydroxylase (fatty acid hydroxylase superfamily)